MAPLDEEVDNDKDNNCAAGCCTIPNEAGCCIGCTLVVVFAPQSLDHLFDKLLIFKNFTHFWG